MWALLDIRQGRANRVQLAVAAISYFFLHYFIIYLTVYSILPVYLFLVANFFSYYLLWVVIIRRYRDRDHNFLTYVLILLAVIYAPFLFLKLPWNAGVYLLMGYLNQDTLVLFFINIVFYGVAFLGLWIPLLLPGDPDINKYGYPPKGLDFRTMTNDTYPKDILFSSVLELKNAQTYFWKS